jgi:hypothetical protein
MPIPKMILIGPHGRLLLCSQGSESFTSGTRRGETSGAYFPFGVDGDFPYLSSSYGSETVDLEEPAEEGSKKKKVALTKNGLAEKCVLTIFFVSIHF